MAFLYLLTKLATAHFCQESITIDKKLKSEVTKLQSLDEDALLESDSLSDLFPHPEPAKKTLHIVIRAPPIGKCSLSISSLVLLH